MLGHLTEHDLKKRQELETAPMQVELKSLERRWTKKGRQFVCEPKEEDEEIPEQVNWVSSRKPPRPANRLRLRSALTLIPTHLCPV